MRRAGVALLHASPLPLLLPAERNPVDPWIPDQRVLDNFRKRRDKLCRRKVLHLLLSYLFGVVAKFSSSYQLHRFPYQRNVVSAFVQMLFPLLLWREEAENSRCGWKKIKLSAKLPL